MKLTLEDFSREFQLYTRNVPCNKLGERKNKSHLRFGQLIVNKYDLTGIIEDDAKLYNAESYHVAWKILYDALIIHYEGG